MPAPESLGTDALKVALDATDALMRYKTFLPSRGLLVMLVSRFRDDTREALGMEAERYPGRGEVFRSLDELTTIELDTVVGATGILLQSRFKAVMNDPYLPRLLERFHADLERQKQEREQIRAAMSS